jgi:serine/threonine-protein kinase HipA
MRIAKIFFNKIYAGNLIETENREAYIFDYLPDYQGPPISLTLPTNIRHYEFQKFPAFFEGLLPEGPQLEALLKLSKLDREDYFGQLLVVGQDLVGAVTVFSNESEA